MGLKSSLKSGPVIYEIVPPRRDPSRFSTELGGVEGVLQDRRIAAINIPELIRRREDRGIVVYSPATIPPEEYAMMIMEYKEPIVNLIAPRMEEDAFLKRARKVLHEYKIPNIVVVGKERRTDRLPGPEVTRALELLSPEKGDSIALGAVCIFSRTSSVPGEEGKASAQREPRRVWLKARAGGDFVTSQINLEAGPAVRFLKSYGSLCEETGEKPLTVFVSLTTVPTPTILSLLESLDVVVPPAVRKRLTGASDMGKESVQVSRDVFAEVVSQAEKEGVRVPLGLQVEQVGVNSGALSLDLLDSVYPLVRGL